MLRKEKRLFALLTVFAILLSLYVPLTVSAAKPDPIVIEGESYFSNSHNIPANCTIGNGTTFVEIKTDSGTTFDSLGEDFYVTYNFTVETAGIYGLILVGNIHKNDYSDCAIRFNGGTYTPLTTANAPGGKPSDSNPAVPEFAEATGNLYRTMLTQELSAGPNTISIKLLNGRNSDGRGWVVLDKFQLDWVGEPGAIVLNCIDFDRSSAMSAAAVNGNGLMGDDGSPGIFPPRYLQIGASANLDNEYSINSDFEVTAKGVYKLSLITSGFNNSSTRSNYSISVDGGEYFDAAAHNTKAYTGTNYRFAEVEIDTPFILDEDTHNISLKITSLVGGNANALFYRVMLEPVDLSQYNNLKFECETGYTLSPALEAANVAGVTNNTTLSDDGNTHLSPPHYLQLSGVPSVDINFANDYTISYTFDVYVAGTYNLSMITSGFNNSNTRSNYSVKVDDGEYFDAAANNTIPYTGSNYRFVEVAFDTPFVFDEGSHTISFKLTSEVGGQLNAIFDSFTFTRVDELDSVLLTLADEYIEIGETTQASVTAFGESGAVLSLIGAEVVYTSCSPEVLTISDSGLITAIGLGDAVITAYVTIGTNTRMNSEFLKVTTNGIYTADLLYFDGSDNQLDALTSLVTTVKATATIENYSGSPKDLVMILALYNDGVLSKLEIEEYPNVTGTDTPVEVTLSPITVDAKTTVRVLVWDSVANLHPLASKAAISVE